MDALNSLSPGVRDEPAPVNLLVCFMGVAIGTRSGVLRGNGSGTTEGNAFPSVFGDRSGDRAHILAAALFCRLDDVCWHQSWHHPAGLFDFVLENKGQRIEEIRWEVAHDQNG